MKSLSGKIAFLLLFCGFASVQACPCFNEGYLQSIFRYENRIECHMYEEEDVVYKIEIHDARDDNRAVSTPTSCALNSPYHNIFINYNDMRNVYANYIDFYHKEQNDCIKQIVDACTRLNVITRTKAQY